MDGMWCFRGRMVARSVVAARGHGGEKKNKESTGCRKLGRKGWFSSNFAFRFLLLLNTKLAAIYRDEIG